MSDTGGHAAPARVLVVDDDKSIRLLCRVNLELDGHEVLEADSLDTARAALATEDVAVVLLDVHLYGQRSDALIGECHAQQPRIPVVLVTGSADIAQERLGAADAVLPKPFELEELLTTVRELAVPATSPGSRR
jgi:DNA-binding NtrC family response regulator